MREQPFVLWLTGLPSAGKTTIGYAVKKKLKDTGNAYLDLLDGDLLRHELSPDLGFTKQDREIHAKRVVYLCKLLSRNGISSIVCLISPYREFRNYARNEITKKDPIYFAEVYVKCSLDTCMKRDRKGLYKKALGNEIKDVTGLQSPYEEPINPELVVDTENESLEEITSKIISDLYSMGCVRESCESETEIQQLRATENRAIGHERIAAYIPSTTVQTFLREFQIKQHELNNFVTLLVEKAVTDHIGEANSKIFTESETRVLEDDLKGLGYI